MTLETPPDFPIDGEISKGDTKKFIVEVKCTDKDDDGGMEWEVLSIDGVKLDEGGSESEDDNDDSFEGYDDSSDEDTDEDISSDGKAKSTKGIGLLIVHGKGK